MLRNKHDLILRILLYNNSNIDLDLGIVPEKEFNAKLPFLPSSAHSTPLKEPRCIFIEDVDLAKDNLFLFQFPAGIVTKDMFLQEPVVFKSKTVHNLSHVRYGNNYVYWFNLNGEVNDRLSIYELAIPYNGTRFAEELRMFDPGMSPDSDFSSYRESTEYEDWLLQPESIIDTEWLVAYTCVYYISLRQVKLPSVKLFNKDGTIDLSLITNDVIRDYFSALTLDYIHIKRILVTACFCGSITQDGTLYKTQKLSNVLRMIVGVDGISRIEDEVSRANILHRILRDEEDVQEIMREQDERSLVLQAQEHNGSLSSFFGGTPYLKGMALVNILNIYQLNKASYINMNKFSTFMRICFAHHHQRT